ncbi:hypothetical protein D3C71_1632800 [compost metagenome]
MYVRAAEQPVPKTLQHLGPVAFAFRVYRNPLDAYGQIGVTEAGHNHIADAFAAGFLDNQVQHIGICQRFAVFFQAPLADKRLVLRAALRLSDKSQVALFRSPQEQPGRFD